MKRKSSAPSRSICKARVSHILRNGELAQSSINVIVQKGKWRTREEEAQGQNGDHGKQGPLQVHFSQNSGGVVAVKVPVCSNPQLGLELGQLGQPEWPTGQSSGLCRCEGTLPSPVNLYSLFALLGGTEDPVPVLKVPQGASQLGVISGGKQLATFSLSCPLSFACLISILSPPPA